MTGNDMSGDTDLDDLFAAARADVPVPSPALMSRVLADADAAQPRPAPRVAAPVLRGAWFATLVAALGGAGAMAGLATATVAGLWIGLAQPAPVAALTQSLWPAAEADIVELLPDLDGVLTDAEG
jgi:hypothetical protein